MSSIASIWRWVYDGFLYNKPQYQRHRALLCNLTVLAFSYPYHSMARLHSDSATMEAGLLLQNGMSLGMNVGKLSLLGSQQSDVVQPRRCCRLWPNKSWRFNLQS